jgi:hypothetical protein
MVKSSAGHSMSVRREDRNGELLVLGSIALNKPHVAVRATNGDPLLAQERSFTADTRRSVCVETPPDHPRCSHGTKTGPGNVNAGRRRNGAPTPHSQFTKAGLDSAVARVAAWVLLSIRATSRVRSGQRAASSCSRTMGRKSVRLSQLTPRSTNGWICSAT